MDTPSKRVKGLTRFECTNKKQANPFILSATYTRKCFFFFFFFEKVENVILFDLNAHIHFKLWVRYVIFSIYIYIHLNNPTFGWNKIKEE